MNEYTHDFRSFSEKLANLLENHRRIIAEFENSLSNAHDFIGLADRSIEKEPENTVIMLEQIREIDLLGHVQRLSEEFDSVRGFIAAAPMEDDIQRHREELEHMAAAYEIMTEKAARQHDRIDSLLTALES